MSEDAGGVEEKYWKADEDVQDKVLELVGAQHPDLAEVVEEGIVAVFRHKATKSAPYGKATKVPELYQSAFRVRGRVPPGDPRGRVAAVHLEAAGGDARPHPLRVWFDLGREGG